MQKRYDCNEIWTQNEIKTFEDRCIGHKLEVLVCIVRVFRN